MKAEGEWVCGQIADVFLSSFLTSKVPVMPQNIFLIKIYFIIVRMLVC